MTETALVQKDCVPCRGGIPPLSAAEVAGLLPQVPGWKARDDDTKIEARYRFKNFRAALDFVRDVGELEISGDRNEIMNQEADLHRNYDSSTLLSGFNYCAIGLSVRVFTQPRP